MTTNASILVISNPRAGRNRDSRLARTVVDRLVASGVRARLEQTTGAGSAETIAAAACVELTPPDCVVPCGGDGTIQEVANALAAARTRGASRVPALGLAPAGRCNDLAAVMGIVPTVGSIASTLLRGQRRPMDLGCVNGRYYCTVLCSAFDAEVSAFVDTRRLWVRGQLAYLYATLKVLAWYRPPRLRIVGDFGDIDRPAFIASCANTSAYGGAIQLVPHARSNDGSLDLCVINAVSRWRALRLLPRALRGKHVHDPAVSFHRTTRLTIDSDRPLDLWADGERVARTPAEITCAAAAIDIIAPA